MIDLTEFTEETDLDSKGVYLITHKQSRIKYVGSTTKSFSFRWRHHLLGFPKDKGNKVLLNVYKKYGMEGFTFTIVEKIEDIELIADRELYWIKQYDTYRTKHGANISLDTRQPLRDRLIEPRTEEQKENYRRACINKKETYVYDKEGNLFKVFESAHECDRFFGIKKGYTSQIITGIGGRKMINHHYIPSYEYIEKESFKSYKPKRETSVERRLYNTKRIKCSIYEKETHDKVKDFESMNECDEYLGLAKGSTSRHLRGQRKFLRRKYYVKIT